MNQFRAHSSPELVRPLHTTEQKSDDPALEGVAANIKLLLKLIQDHKDASDKEKNESRRRLRVATMMALLDNVRDRIQKSQSNGKKVPKPELRRCNTELRPDHTPRDKRRGGEQAVEDEKEKLRRELTASLAVRKSLQVMCSSLGKEKEIMSRELSKKVHELNEMEELVNDLKEQNGSLRQKVQEYASHQREKRCSCGGELQGTAALQERNRALSEQLLRSLDGYRSMKKKLKAAQEQNAMMRATMDEMREKVVIGLERVKSFKKCMSSSSENDPPVDVQEEITELESMFEGFQMLVTEAS